MCNPQHAASGGQEKHGFINFFHGVFSFAINGLLHALFFHRKLIYSRTKKQPSSLPRPKG
jgi:hypothetical protein